MNLLSILCGSFVRNVHLHRQIALKIGKMDFCRTEQKLLTKQIVTKNETKFSIEFVNICVILVDYCLSRRQ